MKLAAKPHQRDGKRQAEYQNHRMLARRACDGQHVVERHRDVSDRDLPYGLAKRLLADRLWLAASIVLADDRL